MTSANFQIAPTYDRLATLYAFSSQNHSDELGEIDSPDRFQEMLRRTAFDHLKFLPKELKHKIYSHISDLDGQAKDDLHYGKTHVFESMPRLQEAIRRIAFEVFDTISEPERNEVSYKVWQYSNAPDTNNAQEWGELHAKDDVSILLGSMSSSLRDLTPQFETILNEWVAQEGGTPHSVYAAETFKYFLKGRDVGLQVDTFSGYAELLGLRICADVSSLPPLFDKKPLISRLQELEVRSPLLTELPKDIRQLSNLWSLTFSNVNPLTPANVSNNLSQQPISIQPNKLTTIPSEIGKLSNLGRLILIGARIKSLPSEIGNLHRLKYLDLRQIPTLKELPSEVFTLPSDCEITLYESSLASDPIFLGNLTQTIEKDPNYKGPHIYYALVQPPHIYYALQPLPAAPVPENYPQNHHGWLGSLDSKTVLEYLFMPTYYWPLTPMLLTVGVAAATCFYANTIILPGGFGGCLLSWRLYSQFGSSSQPPLAFNAQPPLVSSNQPPLAFNAGAAGPSGIAQSSEGESSYLVDNDIPAGKEEDPSSP